MPVTRDQLLKLVPNLKNVSAVVDVLNDAMERFSIDTPKRVAHFLAQISHESGGFTAVRENLNYSANALMKCWPSRFKTFQDAQWYERQPIKIANYVYANRMGNGDAASGDGYKFRGAGWIQITGRSNHKEVEQALGIKGDVGEFLSTLHGAALSAAWFFWKSGCNALADANNIDGISDVINIGRRTQKYGDSIGFAEREAKTKLMLKVMNETV